MLENFWRFLKVLFFRQGEAKVFQTKEGEAEEVEVGSLSMSQYFG